MNQSSPSRANDVIAAMGGRITEGRRRTLDTLLDAGHPLSHPEIESRLALDGAKLDRVTLYRVLDWLVSSGLAHKIEGQDRVWRFGASPGESHGHAHFNCSRCGKVYCLPNIKPAYAASLPAGFRVEEIALSLRGLCPDCTA